MAPFGHDAAACWTLARRCSGGSSISSESSSSSPTSNTSGAIPMQSAFDSHRFQFTRTRMFPRVPSKVLLGKVPDVFDAVDPSLGVQASSG
jgi:hypothetical protein